MVPLAERFTEWNDFPKGLHVLVVDKNKSLLNDVKLKLEAWDYVVTAFDNETVAFAALQNQSNEFHMLLIEVPSKAEANDFKLLQAAENVPTILMTDTEDMAIMMQGIALGASDFLQKPISDEKLKSIWQHVARKAISAARLPLPASFQSQKSENSKDVSISFEPLTRRTASDRFSEPATPQLQQVERISSPAYALEDSFNSSDGVLNNTEVDHFEDYFTMPDEYAEQRSDGRDGADESCHSCSDAFEQLQSELYAEFELGDNFDDFTLSSNLVVDENVIAELDTESNILSEMSVVRNLNMIDCMDNAQAQEADAIEEEALLLAEVAKAEKKCKNVRSQLCKKQQQTGSNGKDGSREDHNKQKRADATIDERGKSNKRCVAGNRKMKVDWTAELHRRFVQAVEQLGVEKAIPSRILEIMGVESLTRHNVASHLQKYRSHRRHLEARDTEGTNWSYNSSGNLDGGSWTKTRREGGNSWSSSTSHHSSLLPIQPKPPIRCSPIHLAPPPHVWGHPTLMWQKPNIAALAPAGGTWQASQQAAFPDAWGHPVPVPGTPCYLQPIMSIPLVPRPGIANMTVDPAGVPGDVDRLGCGLETGRNSDFDPPQETVDAAINEVLKDPWAPLPLGLKPPSLDSVMSELQRQGITSALPILASS